MRKTSSYFQTGPGDYPASNLDPSSVPELPADSKAIFDLEIEIALIQLTIWLSSKIRDKIMIRIYFYFKIQGIANKLSMPKPPQR